MSEKVCFLLRIEPHRIPEYLAFHENVWPEMLEELRDAGYRNYSMFVDSSGLLVGYLETDDFAATLAAIQSTEVNARWSEATGDMFVPVDAQRPVDAVVALRHAFDLDAQLERVGA